MEELRYARHIPMWKESISVFADRAAAFVNGEITRNEWKGTSGGFGVYAQREEGRFMLRLRMPAGEVTREKLSFVRDVLKKEQVSMLHFTTCQTIQLHNLDAEKTERIMRAALDADIVTMGGGGDFPRNIMCSPLAGIDPEEPFSVLPYARAAGEFLLDLLPEGKFPRKLKVGFSSDSENLTHASIRDIGFIARKDGTFTVYSAGGLGNNPKLGIHIADGVAPEDAVYFVKAVRRLFLEHGDRENRSKARVRFIPQRLGSEEAYKSLLLQYAQEAKEEGGLQGERNRETDFIKGTEKEMRTERVLPKRVLAQKQAGYYAVSWHPIGGSPSVARLIDVADFLLSGTEKGELRIGPDGSAYLIFLTEDEISRALELTEGGGETLFECSTSCVGAGICQQGIGNSALLLQECIDAVRSDGAKEGSLPKLHISGCPSSCGTHQVGEIGLRGGKKKIDGEATEVFSVSLYGSEQFGKEALGKEIGVMKSSEIPEFLVEVKRAVEKEDTDFVHWIRENPGALEAVAEKYLR